MKITRLMALILASLSLGVTACAEGDTSYTDSTAVDSRDAEVGVQDDALLEEEDEIDMMDESGRSPASVEEQPVEESRVDERHNEVAPDRSVADRSPSNISNMRPEDMSRDQVRHVQQALNQRGYNIAVDGIFGPETRRAITQFQANNNIEQTGDLNQETMAALNIESGRTPASVPARDVESQKGEANPMGTSERGTDLGTGRTMTDEGVQPNESQIDADPSAQ